MLFILLITQTYIKAYIPSYTSIQKRTFSSLSTSSFHNNDRNRKSQFLSAASETTRNTDQLNKMQLSIDKNNKK